MAARKKSTQAQQTEAAEIHKVDDKIKERRDMIVMI
jgi:hypothetical protein